MNEKQKIALFLFIVLLVIGGVCVDVFMPFNYWVNFLRAGIALIVGLTSYGYLLMYTEKRSNQKMSSDSEYKPLRRKFSYHERINISVVLWGIWTVLLLLCANHSPLFTLLSSMLIVFALSILSFMRAYRDEYLKSIYKIPDTRDTDFKVKLQQKMEERQAKLDEEKRKKDLLNKNK